jgi:3-oxoacyl-[acyl-carrier protein] reductase
MRPDAPFAGRLALVTGASGGIGAALSIRLAASGAAVAAHYASNRASALRVVESITSAGGHAMAFPADLRDPEAPQRLVADVQQELGPIDLLVANAGLGRRASFEEVGAHEFDEMLAVNLRAPYLLARGVLSGMQARGYGRIVFMSSVAALTGGILGPHYAASKAGLHGLTHFLASRVAKDGVTVNALAPALIQDTDMLPSDPGDLAARIPVGRLGTPGEVADLAVAVMRNGYVTNQVIAVDGGIHPR